MESKHIPFLEKACEFASAGMRANKGGPFGALVVHDGKVIGTGCNEVLASNNPVAHAEINAIQAACKALNTFHLTGATLYSTCEPCPMCLAALYWARIEKIIFALSRVDAARMGFDDHLIYSELGIQSRPHSLKMEHVPLPQADALLKEWMEKKDKVIY